MGTEHGKHSGSDFKAEEDRKILPIFGAQVQEMDKSYTINLNDIPLNNSGFFEINRNGRNAYAGQKAPLGTLHNHANPKRGYLSHSMCEADSGSKFSYSIYDQKKNMMKSTELKALNQQIKHSK